MQPDTKQRSIKTPQSAAEAQKRFDRDLREASSGIRALRVVQQRFLAGDLSSPPLDDTLKLRRLLRSLRARARGVQAQFQLTNLEAQLQSHLDLFGRRLDAREQSARQPSDSAGPQPKLDAERGVVVGSSDDSAAEAALFRQLTRDPRAAAKLDPARFRNMIQQHVAAIKKKTGCREILFRVVIEDGKPKLKAKPLKTP
jgi:hypothetical protein